MDDDKPLTQQEFARMGANATNNKYSKETRSEWAKRGVNKLKEKYGEDYFKQLAQKGLEARKQKKLDKLETKIDQTSQKVGKLDGARKKIFDLLYPKKSDSK